MHPSPATMPLDDAAPTRRTSGAANGRTFAALVTTSGRAAIVLLVLTIALAAHSASASPQATMVAGGGSVTLTYNACTLTAWSSGGSERPGCRPQTNSPGLVTIAAQVTPDGTARGRIAFTLFNPFARDGWYGTPLYTSEAYLRLEGQVTAGSVSAGSSVTLSGTLTERDFDARGHLLFSACDQPGCNEPAQPFTVVVGPGDKELTLNWCELPGPFALRLTAGHLQRSGAQASSVATALTYAATSSCTRGQLTP